MYREMDIRLFCNSPQKVPSPMAAIEISTIPSCLAWILLSVFAHVLIEKYIPVNRLQY